MYVDRRKDHSNIYNTREKKHRKHAEQKNKNKSIE